MHLSVCSKPQKERKKKVSDILNTQITKSIMYHKTNQKRTHTITSNKVNKLKAFF